MTNETVVRRLRPEEWPAFRELRLAALRTDPLAFGSTASREAGYPDGKWQDWALRGSTGTREVTFVVTVPSGQLVGMAGAFWKDERFHLWGMWVHPSWRGQGLGRDLLDAILYWLDERFPGCGVLLDVNPDQVSAVRTYLGCGFHFNGVEQPLGHDPPAVTRQMIRGPASQP
jgi:ribosomal protein S18 acetylase RimI-like enzyme